MKIELSLPGFYGQIKDVTETVIKLMEKYPEKFNEDVFIGSVYGSYPCIFNGGRILEGDFNIKDVAKDLDFLNSRNIKARYTFTNCMLRESDLCDCVSNEILNEIVANQKMKNDINFGSEIMKKYIETKFPDLFNLVYSTTFCISDVDKINEISKNYLIVPDYTVNNDFEKLAKLTNPENTEFLLNDACVDHCPVRRKHYEHYSNYILKREKEFMTCAAFNDDFNYYRNLKNIKHHIYLKDIYEKYLPLGINKFKIAGRKMDILATIEGLLEYIAKPEYRDEIRFDILWTVMYKTVQ